MNNCLANSLRWEWFSYPDDPDYVLGYISCHYLGWRYTFCVGKDYALMKHKDAYFWYLLSEMTRRVTEAECPM